MRFEGTLNLHITGAPLGSRPADDAGYFYFAEYPNLGYVGVYESYNTPTGVNYGTIDLYGRIGSLIPTRFDNAQGVVLAAQLPTPPVPEPASWALMAAGLFVLMGCTRCRHS